MFLNLAGGFRVEEPAIDLAVVCAILSSDADLPVPHDTAFCGEVGLTGEVRPVPRTDQRIAEARKLGFTRVFVPKGAPRGCLRERTCRSSLSAGWTRCSGNCSGRSELPCRHERRRSNTELAEDRTELALLRTLQATDRTLMAWMRTTLAMIAFGFGFFKFYQLGSFGAETADPITTDMIALGLVGLGTVLPIGALVQYVQVRRKLRHPEPVGPRSPGLAGALCLTRCAAVRPSWT